VPATEKTAATDRPHLQIGCNWRWRRVRCWRFDHVVGATAMGKIRKRGALIVLIGLGAVGLCWWHYWNRPNPGPIQIDIKTISNFQMDQVNTTVDDLPRAVRHLDGNRVAIVGDVWSPDDAVHVKHFELTDLSFGEEHGPPKAQRFVFCTVVDSSSAATSQPVCTGCTVVATGPFHVGVTCHPETGRIDSVFRLDVEDIKLAPTLAPAPALPRGIVAAMWSGGGVLAVVIGALAYARAGRPRRRMAAGLCVRCGYDLRASPVRCPECGLDVPGRSRTSGDARAGGPQA